MTNFKIPISASEYSKPMHETLEIDHARFRFVFCELASKNAEQIAQELVDCDVIALATLGAGSQAQRDEISNLFTDYIASATDEATTADIEQRLEQTYPDPLWREVLSHLLATDKQVVTIGMNSDHEDFDLVRKWADADRSVEYTAFSRPQYLLHALMNVASTATVMAEKQEALLVEQLNLLGKNNPGKSIGVALGALHTFVQHETSKAYPSERTFIVTDEATGATQSENVNFSYLQQLTRSLRFERMQHIDPAFMDRMLLQRSLEYYKDKRVLREDIDRMGDDEVARMLAEVTPNIDDFRLQ